MAEQQRWPKVVSWARGVNSPLPCRVGGGGYRGISLTPAFRCFYVCNPQGLPGKGAMLQSITLWLGCTHSIWDPRRGMDIKKNCFLYK